MTSELETWATRLTDPLVDVRRQAIADLARLEPKPEGLFEWLCAWRTNREEDWLEAASALWRAYQVADPSIAALQRELLQPALVGRASEILDLIVEMGDQAGSLVPVLASAFTHPVSREHYCPCALVCTLLRLGAKGVDALDQLIEKRQYLPDLLVTLRAEAARVEVDLALLSPRLEGLIAEDSTMVPWLALMTLWRIDWMVRPMIERLDRHAFHCLDGAMLTDLAHILIEMQVVSHAATAPLRRLLAFIGEESSGTDLSAVAARLVRGGLRAKALVLELLESRADKWIDLVLPAAVTVAHQGEFLLGHAWRVVRRVQAGQTDVSRETILAAGRLIAGQGDVALPARLGLFVERGDMP